MMYKVTASGAGAGLKDEARNPAFGKRREQPRPEEAAAPADADKLDINVSQARYRAQASLAQEAGLNAAVTFSQTQADFLRVVQTALDRMCELSVLCQDTTKTDVDRAGFTAEFTQLQHFISDIGTKKFNGLSLFGGENPALGAGDQTASIPLNAIAWNAPGPPQGLSIAYDGTETQITTDDKARGALENLRLALGRLQEMQLRVSSNLTRLSLSSEQLAVLNDNLSAATQRLNEIDWAGKLTEIARFRILGHSETAAQAQANARPQTTIQLLNPPA